MSKVKRGSAAEYIFKAKALLAGFDVFSEDNQDSKVDLILSKDSKLYRIQVKIINPQGQLPTRKLNHSKTEHKISRYSKKDIDFFVAVDLMTFDCYIFPVEFTSQFKSTLSIKLHGENYKNNFNLQEPYIGNFISADPQVGETLGKGNTELDLKKSSVETLRDPSKFTINEYDEDKVQTTNRNIKYETDFNGMWMFHEALQKEASKFLSDESRS